MESFLLMTIQMKNIYKFLLIKTEWLYLNKWCHEVFESKCAIHEIKKHYFNIYESNFPTFEQRIFIQKIFRSIEFNFENKDELNFLFNIFDEEKNVKH